MLIVGADFHFEARLKKITRVRNLSVRNRTERAPPALLRRIHCIRPARLEYVIERTALVSVCSTLLPIVPLRFLLRCTVHSRVSPRLGHWEIFFLGKDLLVRAPISQGRNPRAFRTLYVCVCRWLGRSLSAPYNKFTIPARLWEERHIAHPGAFSKLLATVTYYCQACTSR